VGLIALLAVLAPLLANSRPYLLKMDGRWSSPLIEGLLWSDVAVMATVTVLITVAIFGRRWRPRVRVVLTAVLLIATGAASFAALSARSDRIEIYSQYREATTAGRVQWSLNAPIPYSPQDYQRDRFALDDPHPWDPRPGHRLGTDRNGGDIASRMIHACRIALSVGFIAEGVAMLIGVAVGGLMGYFSGVVDLLGMRLVEIFSSIPQLYLLLAFVAFFRRDLYLIMLIIGLTSWTGYAVFTRAEFLRLRNQDFVQAAIASGLSTPRVIFLHLLPNGLAPILVSASFGVASAILAESTLSFLGVGLVGDPSWGSILNQAVGESRFYWWLAVFPGTAIFLTVLAYNLIGEALRDALDPKLLKRE
jgi:peptide/nickel transport system permease protein